MEEPGINIKVMYKQTNMLQIGVIKITYITYINSDMK